MISTGKLYLSIALIVLIHTACNAQTTYDLFEVKNDDVYWRNSYQYNGSSDSLRTEIVRMLKSKYYTFNVFRNQAGYTGEIQHYKVDCKKYGRKYINTNAMYWSGEWSGKFVVEVQDNSYRVTVYGLYADKYKVANPNPKVPQRESSGRYFEVITTKDRKSLKKSEQANIHLMSVSLKDNFDIRNTLSPTP